MCVLHYEIILFIKQVKYSNIYQIIKLNYHLFYIIASLELNNN